MTPILDNIERIALKKGQTREYLLQKSMAPNEIIFNIAYPFLDDDCQITIMLSSAFGKFISKSIFLPQEGGVVQTTMENQEFKYNFLLIGSDMDIDIKMSVVHQSNLN